jgi:hypothetical protein
MPLNWISRLIQRNPTDNLKFVYMVRDPRGRFWSHYVKSLSKHPNIPKAFLSVLREDQRVWCRRLQEERDWLLDHIQQYDTRLFILRYEDLAANPHEYANKLYSFLDIKSDPLTMKWLDTITRGEKDGGWMNTVRRNSTFTATRWRAEIPSWAYRIITDACKDALHSWHFEKGGTQMVS